MPKGYKHLTRDWKEKIRKSMLGRTHSKETIEKIRIANLGRKHIEEELKKMRRPRSEKAKEHMRKPKSEAHKEKIRETILRNGTTRGKNNGMYGRKNHWGRHTMEWRKMMSERMKGRTFSKETIEKMRIVASKRVISQKTREKMRETAIKNGRKPPCMKGIKRSPETRNKIRIWHLNHPNKKFKDTSIELKMRNALLNLGLKEEVDFFRNINVENVANVDFYFPSLKLIIQCDGNYWHNLPKRRERDFRQDSILNKRGYEIYRFWENEINRSVYDCIKTIQFKI